MDSRKRGPRDEVYLLCKPAQGQTWVWSCFASYKLDKVTSLITVCASVSSPIKCAAWWQLPQQANAGLITFRLCRNTFCLWKNALCLRKKPEIKFKELAVPRHINGAVNYYDLDTGHSWLSPSFMNKTFRCLFACHGGDRIVEAICISESWERRELLFLMQIPFPLWTCQRLYNEDAYHRCQQPFWSSRLLSLVWFWFELWWLKKKNYCLNHCCVYSSTVFSRFTWLCKKRCPELLHDLVKVKLCAP